MDINEISDIQLKALYDYMENVTKNDCCVAFSGGVDSTLLLKAACDCAAANKTTVHAVTFETRLHPKADLPEAKAAAAACGAEHYVVHVNELDNPAILNNPVERCYFCKKYLFEHLLSYAGEHHVKTVMEGTNADDLKAYRPGIRAVRELGVESPLAVLGFAKTDIRRMAGLLGLSQASKPSAPCLATRLPYGTEISFELLEKIDCGEIWLKSLGFEVIRLRVHGDIVRIEIPKEKFAAFLEKADEITVYLKGLGFDYITLDMEGFRSGSMDIHISK